jgi:RNA polymerase sigma-70 factor (ECF subfamily)
MAVQAISGEAILKQTTAAEASQPATMEDLVANHTGLVFRIAYSILRNHHDAEDAAQECFLRAWKWRDKFQQVRKPKTWLARIAWTTALDRRAHRTTRSVVEDTLGENEIESVAGSECKPDEQLAGLQMQQLLEKLIAALPGNLRQPLELSTVQELNSSEIAEIMGVPESSVRTRLFRARGILKEKLSALEVTSNG